MLEDDIVFDLHRVLDAGGTCKKTHYRQLSPCVWQFADGVGTNARFAANRRHDYLGVGVDPTTGNMYVNWGEPW